MRAQKSKGEQQHREKSQQARSRAERPSNCCVRSLGATLQKMKQDLTRRAYWNRGLLSRPTSRNQNRIPHSASASRSVGASRPCSGAEVGFPFFVDGFFHPVGRSVPSWALIRYPRLHLSGIQVHVQSCQRQLFGIVEEPPTPYAGPGLSDSRGWVRRFSTPSSKARLRLILASSIPALKFQKESMAEQEE